MEKDDQFAAIAGEVARDLLGEPNKRLSTRDELRYGTNGSLSVDVKKGTFFDHSEDAGGGVLWLVERETGRKGKEAVDWLREQGFDIEDRGAPPPQGAGDYGGKPSDGPAQARMKPVATWDYHTADGSLLFQVVRLESGEIGKDGKPVKSYRQRKPDDSKPGGWDWKTKGLKMVPYRLPEVRKAIEAGETVFVVEGEKAADRLWADGIPATTNPRGAGKWVNDLNDHLAGGSFVVIPDNDPQSKYQDGRLKFHDNGDPVLVGQDHAKEVAGQLLGVAKEVNYMELPGVPLKGDVVDWFEQGGDADALYNLVDNLPKYEPEPYRSAFRALTWSSLDDPGPEHEWLVKNTITRNELAMIAGPSKSGKSFLVLDMALAIARGEDWFGRKTRRGGVIYQAGEGAMGIKKRLRAYRDHHDLSLKDDIPFVLLPARVDLYGSDDHTDKMISEVEHWKRTFDVPLELIVIDTWATATPGANENDGKDVSIVLERCSRINRETGAAVLLVHHMNADGGKVRGHTSILANLENVLIVKQVEDHHDGMNRQIREAVVDKNKDGEGGQSFRFVLRGVQIGIDEDGDPMTSCVVQQPDGAGSEVAPSKKPNITNSEAVLIRAVERAIEEAGGPPPMAANLPAGVEQVVDWKNVATAYDGLTFDDDGSETESDEAREKRLAARRKTLSRCGESLMRKGIISREKPWVWLTGRKIKGYRNEGHASTQNAAPPPDHTEGYQSGWDEEDFR